MLGKGVKGRNSLVRQHVLKIEVATALYTDNLIDVLSTPPGRRLTRTSQARLACVEGGKQVWAGGGSSLD